MAYKLIILQQKDRNKLTLDCLLLEKIIIFYHKLNPRHLPNPAQYNLYY